MVLVSVPDMEGKTNPTARYIGSRPADPASSAPRSAVAGVILAAGRSRRFGENKLLAPFKGKPLLRWVVEAALRSRLASLLVVLGHEHARVREALIDLDEEPRLSFVVNECYGRGQSTSVVAGLAAVSPASAGAMFFVGDQPLLDSSVIDRLIAAFEASDGGICYPTCDGRRGNPVIFGCRFFAELQRLSGDRGGGVVIETHPEATVPVDFSDPMPFRDIDSRSDLDLFAFGGAAGSRPAEPTTVAAALGLETSRVISLCGAGGKTSLMATLVREFASLKGERIIATTTTKMASDEAHGPWRACQVMDQADALAAIGDDPDPVLAYRAVDHQRVRLLGLPAETVDAFASSGRFTRILVEADGSRRRPLKAPDAGEPVFPASTDTVIIVAGISGIGRPLDENTVFRSGRWSELTGVPASAIVTADALARVIEHPDGLARGAPPHARRVLFLNQADTPDRVAVAHQVLQALWARGRRPPERAAIGRLRPEVRICAWRASGTPDLQVSGGENGR